MTKVLFLGSKNLGLKLLMRMADLAPSALVAIATLDDTADARGCLPDFRAFTDTRKVPLEVLSKGKDLDAVLDRHRPDLVVVCGWYWKIPAELLAKVPGGFVGLHASLLPRYRGHAPLVWTLYNGDSEGGLSLFYLEPGLDTGDILAQKKFPLGPEATIAEALALAESHAEEALQDTYRLLLEGRAPRRPQDQSQATFCSQRKPEDGLVDWKLPAAAVHNAIRAQTHPYPGAFTLWQGRKLYLWKATPFAGEYYGIPGLTVEISGREAVVACGHGAIRLQEIQLEGDSPASAAEVLKYGVRLG
jgi:methionyl-tRNA formyltransferase